MITACSYNSIIGIKYISYWFMSCLPLAFLSVWIYTISQVSSDVLLCNLRGWMGWLLPYFLFDFLKDLGDTVLCSPCTVHHLDFSAWFLSHPVFTLLHGFIVEMWQKLASGGSVSRCSWEYLVCCHTLNIPLSPGLLLFFLLSEFWSCAGSAG